MICTRCQEEKPEDMFRMYKRTGKCRTICKACEKAEQKKYLQELREGTRTRYLRQTHKICSSCGLDKPNEQFYYFSSSQNYDYICRDCRHIVKIIDGKRRCKKCGVLKFLANFPPNRAVCRDCLNKDKPRILLKERQKEAEKRNNLYCYMCRTEKPSTEFAYKTRCKKCNYKPVHKESKRNSFYAYQQALFTQGKKYCNCCKKELSFDSFRTIKSNPTKPSDYAAFCRSCFSMKYGNKFHRQKINHLDYINKELVCDLCKNILSIREFSRLKKYQSVCNVCRNKVKQQKKNKRKKGQDDFHIFQRKMRNRLRENLRQSKSNTTSFYFGCSYKELYTHIESQFIGDMSWQNYGEWEIDHYIPKAFFKTYYDFEKGQRICWNFRNLRPLWREENQKKSDILPSDYMEKLLAIESTLEKYP